MNNQNYTTSFSVDQSPEEVYKAITNVRGWWTENMQGNAEQLHDEFEVRFGDIHYSRQKLTEVIPGEKMVWLVTDSHLSFLDDTDEWTGTRIHFDISRKGDQTELRLTHTGLVPEVECYSACSVAWGQYMRNSLYCLITKGKGQPGFPPSEPL